MVTRKKGIQQPAATASIKKLKPQDGSAVKMVAIKEDYQAKDFHKNPSWRFHRADKNGPFAWPDRCEKTALEVYNFLHSLDSQSWHTIFSGTSHHNIQFHAMSPDAQSRFRNMCLENHCDSLISLRMTGIKRIFCYISDGHVGNIVWYDPEHRVCLSHKKHT